MIDFIFNGFVCMANGDGGDGLQKTTLVDVIQRRHGQVKFKLNPEAAEVSPGIWVRYPYTDSWISDPKSTSRDQIMSLVIWTGYAGRKDLLTRQLKEQVKRLGFYQNSYHIWPGDNPVPKPWYQVDFASPEHWGQYIRSYAMISRHWGWNFFRPLLTVTDLFMLGNAVVTNVVGYFNPDHSDDDNFVLGMIQAYDSLDTPVAMASRWLYKRRPTAGYTDETKTVSLRSKGVKDFWSAIKYKHRSAGGAPPIGQLFDELKVKDRF
jgi:hypothetical protein